MDRKTGRSKEGYAHFLCISSFDLQMGLTCHKIAELYKAADKLASYEEAASLEKVQEWVKAEREGTLVVLPCKVGDTVYWVGSECDYETCLEYSDYCHLGCEKPSIAKVCETLIRQFRLKDGRFSSMTNTDALASSFEKTFYLADFGKTVFGTREEAEVALSKQIKE